MIYDINSTGDKKPVIRTNLPEHTADIVRKLMKSEVSPHIVLHKIDTLELLLEIGDYQSLASKENLGSFPDQEVAFFRAVLPDTLTDMHGFILEVVGQLGTYQSKVGGDEVKYQLEPIFNDLCRILDKIDLIFDSIPSLFCDREDEDK